MKIGFLGLGAMGSRMARRLLDAGHELAVWNRSAERAASLVAAGARLAETPFAAAEGADLVLTMVTDDEAARQVWLHPETGALAGVRQEAIAVESSTVTPAWVRELSAAVKERGCALLDAPVAGSTPQAEAGQLIFLVGGPAEALSKVQGALDAMGGATHHIGDVGAGSTMKLAVNALFGIQVATMAELLHFLGRSGIDPAAAAETLGALPVTSPAAKGAAMAIVSKKFAPLFPIDLVAKDLRYATEAAQANGCDTPTVSAVRKVFEAASAKGFGDANITGVAKLYPELGDAPEP